MIQRPHWSYSQISQFLRCPLQFYFERIAKLPKEFVSSNLLFGSAVHEALASYHLDLQTGRPTTADKIKQTFLSGWEQRQSQGPIQFAKNETAAGLRDLGVSMLEAYAKEPPPQQIMAVEHELVVPLYTSQGEFLEKPLVAVLDLLCKHDDQVTVVEFKTSQRKYTAADVDRSLQSIVYRHAVQEKYDQTAQVRYAVLVKTKTPSVQYLEATSAPNDVQRLGDIVETVETAIQAHVFYPIESAINCSGCSFRRPCREWGRTCQPLTSMIEVSPLREVVRC